MYKLFFDSDCDITLEVARHYKADLISMPYVIEEEIYPYKEDGYAICFYENRGPIFGNAHDISIVGNPLKEKKSYTKESLSCCSYKFQGDKNALSEDGRGRYFNLKEYEVFQVIFK